ncbi:MAG: protein kinase [Kineosporiaceae bacterium]|nr:protein kinase [Kineosporiaceae bacterium]
MAAITDVLPFADDEPVVPGYRMLRRLGVGAHATVWLAEQVETGRSAAVKVAHPGDPTARAAVEWEHQVLQRVRHPHLTRPVQATRLDDARTALVLDHAGGGSLADLIAARGGLRPGEVSTVLVGVARGLTALHGAGLAHGDLTAANVLLTATGRPVLADLGSATELTADGVHAGDDLRALGALIRVCLTGVSRPTRSDLAAISEPAALALLDLAESCGTTRADGVRPLPAEIARQAWTASPPQAIRLVAPQEWLGAGVASMSRPDPTVRHRVAESAAGPSEVRLPAEWDREPTWTDPDALQPTRRRRWVRVAAVATLATAVGSLVGVLLATRTPGPSPESVAVSSRPGSPAVEGSPASPALPDLAAVRHLASARGTALVAASADALRAADLAGSAAMVADRKVVDQLRRNGSRLVGLTFTVHAVHVLPVLPVGPVGHVGQGADGLQATPAGAGVEVMADVSTSGYQQIDAAGRVTASAPARAHETVRLALRHTAGGWRVVSARISAAADAPAGSGRDE